MAIAVSCKCGKTLKVKDELAGKKVRCPGCKAVLAIPAGGSKGAAPASEFKEALMRFEKIQENKQKSAEEEASYRSEHNKLIESYDQLSGKDPKKKEKRLRAGERKRKATAIDKVADAAGVVKGNLFVKYLVITAILGAACVGMVYLVQYVATYATAETEGPKLPKKERVKALFAEAEKAIAEKRWSEAKDALDTIERIEPTKVMHRDYQRMRKELAAAVQSGKAKH